MPDSEDDYDAWGAWGANAKSAPLTEASASAASHPAEQEQEVAVPPRSSETMDIEEVSGDR